MSSSDGNNLSKKISALESSGFSPDEINEVLKRLGTVARVADNDIYVETLGSWMLNYALPSIIVLGTGALFFLLTGGEVEPSITAERPCDSDSELAITHESNYFQEEGINVDDDGLSQSLGRNNRSVSAQNDSAASGESDSSQNTGRVRKSRGANDLPFRDPSSYIAEDDNEYGRKLDNMYSEASEQFLKELLVMTTTIAADVKTIKEEMLKLNTTVSAAPTADSDAASEVSDAEGKATPPVQLTTEQYLAILRSAVKEILNQRVKTIIDNKSDALTGSSPDLLNAESEGKKNIGSLEGDDAFKKSCGALTMYVRNVLDNPTLPRYRKITTTNASFKTLVLPLTGYVEVLNAIGFRSSGTGASNFEWTWQSEASQPDAKDKDSAVRFNGKPDEAGVKEILAECIRLFEICTIKGPLALIAELDKLSTEAVTPASIETKGSGAEETSSAAVRAASSSVLSEVKSTTENSGTDSMSEAKSVGEVRNDISVAMSSKDKGPESTELREVLTAAPSSSLCFKDVMQIVSKPQVPSLPTPDTKNL